MPNTINLSKQYTALVDEVYKLASVTGNLTAPDGIVRAGSTAKTVVYPQIKTSGLGDYDRNTGYTDNSVSVDWVEAPYNYDRGTRISVDVMDNQETMNVAFGQAASDLIRRHAAPEGDAFVFAKLSEKAGTIASADIEKTTILDALYDGTVAMDEKEVPLEGRILYITPTLHKMIQRLDTTVSREILANFASVIEVPQNRFYTSITLDKQDGFTFTKGGFKINFMIADPKAVIKQDKHIVGDRIPAAQNPKADADIYKYRRYSIVDVFANKHDGIYLNHVSTAVA